MSDVPEHVHDPVAEDDKDAPSFMLNESAIEAAAAAAVAAVGDVSRTTAMVLLDAWRSFPAV